MLCAVSAHRTSVFKYVSYLLPVRDDLRACSDGGGLLAGAEVRAVGVAREVRVGGVGDRVVGVPLALDAALPDRGVVRLEPRKFMCKIGHCGQREADIPLVGGPSNVVAQDTAVRRYLRDTEEERNGEYGGRNHAGSVLADL